MSWKNLSLGQRIVALCVLVVILVCGIAASSYVGILQLNRGFHAALASTEEINAVNQLEAGIQRTRAATNEYLATDRAADLEEAKKQQVELHDQIANLRANSSELNVTTVAGLEKTLETYTVVFEKISVAKQKIASLRDEQIGPQIAFLQGEVNSYLADARSSGNVGSALSSATSLGELYAIESLMKDFLRTGEVATVTQVKEKLNKLSEDIGELKRQLEELRELDETLFDADTYQRFESWQIQLLALTAAVSELQDSVLMANKETAESLRPLRDQFAAGILQLQENVSQAQVALNQSVEDTTNGGKILVGIVSVVGIAVIFVLSFFIVRSTTRRIQEVANHIFHSSSETREASGQISRSSEVLADGASRQAASLEETSASLEEMAGMTRSNAANAEEASRLATEARSAAETGSKDMQQMTEAMNAIQSSSDNISKIIRTIDEIAFQTNLLALNAAVEAARAGEAGAGFAVVADEVRSLAHRSAEAARETTAKIEDSLQKSANGVRICNKVGDSLDQIVERTRNVDQLVGQISASSKEQSSGITQIERAVSDIDKLTQENAGLAEETSSASQMLMDQSRSMEEAVTDLFHVIGLRQNEEMVASAKAQGSRTKPRAQAQSNVDWEEAEHDHRDRDDDDFDEKPFFGSKPAGRENALKEAPAPKRLQHQKETELHFDEEPKRQSKPRALKAEHKPETPSFFRLNGDEKHK
ncbi:MAG: methyl-accepting chemotaxis protein [Verrucomicrobiota bacterium JB022]|nr:methyl-accepting chemotaxis protein [Verrucomicrobiota bacterium JB022]